ncbi:beta-lactamase family protein [Bdellovibrio bacteriovorus]|uniref:serine hydrolase domain-containing protein n=1 Tax=Bdellovibrio bacteriovorus TaxID=959 RepID=UPI0021D2F1C7|nr:serine hydrolase domain-containing protein [Bdellovibrio bacteriovorus]UXR64311.1 beta-lactamase family protein [Bdellovibrio bacteriovorus]
MKSFMLMSALALTLISCASKTTKTKTVDEAGAFIAGYIERHNIPAASLAISHNGHIVLQKGYGYADVEMKMAPAPNTVFRIASVSKPITAVAVFKLLEDSDRDLQTALDKPVFGKNGYLPQYKKIKDARILKITLRDLLQHTGGWNSESYDPQYDVYHIAKKMKTAVPASGDTVIRYVLQYKKLDVDPGKEYHYSNLGYNILARVIESLSKMPYEQYVQEKIFAPIGIVDMKIAGNTLKDRLPLEARYYDDPRYPQPISVFDNKTKGPQAYNGFAFHTMDGHGGWLATPTDLVKFADAVTPGAGKVQLLKPETIKVMTTANPATGNPTASLGWVSTEDGKSIAHAGALETSTLSYLNRRSDGTTWAVIFNRLPVKDLADIGVLAQDLMSGMDQALHDFK